MAPSRRSGPRTLRGLFRGRNAAAPGAGGGGPRGTASIGANGETLHEGDFRAQTRRTFANIAALLESEGASWQDIVRTTCYLRDIERDYAAFNEERSALYRCRNSI